jgi:hypothetical protein
VRLTYSSALIGLTPDSYAEYVEKADTHSNIGPGRNALIFAFFFYRATLVLARPRMTFFAVIPYEAGEPSKLPF